jgi:transcriptional regulator with XRE-family HTH domain
MICCMAAKQALLDPALGLDMPAVIAAIEDERASRELSYAQTARELGVTYRTVAYWRQGHCVMSGEVMLRVCLWTGRSITSFARHPGDAPSTREVA